VTAVAGDTDPAVAAGGEDPGHPAAELLRSQPEVESLPGHRSRGLDAQASTRGPALALLREHPFAAASINKDARAHEALLSDDGIALAGAHRLQQHSGVRPRAKNLAELAVIEGRERVGRHDRDGSHVA
jgi:hypothetical protein